MVATGSTRGLTAYLLSLLAAASIFLLSTSSFAQNNVAMTAYGAAKADQLISSLGARPALALDTARLSKWTRAVSAHEAEIANPAECHYAHPAFCFQTYWSELVNELSALDRDEQIRRVNDEVNRFAYRSDRANWGRKDYWATPAEVFAKGAGDCEDLAMFKYMLLQAVNFAAQDLRLTVVATESHAHMVLVAAGETETLVLDNLASQVVAAADYNGYTPIYSLSQDGWQMLATEKARYQQVAWLD